MSAPVRAAPWEYFTRTIEGQQYDVHCRRPAALPALPDPDAPPGPRRARRSCSTRTRSRQGHDYFALGDLEVNPAQTLAAYSTDTTGGERYDLRFRDLATGDDLDDVVTTCTTASRGRTTTARASTSAPTTRCARGRSWRHTLGTPADDDVLVFQEDDERFFVRSTAPAPAACCVITSASKVTTEVWLVDADDAPADAARRRAARAGSRVPRRALTDGASRRPALRAHQRRRRRELRADRRTRRRARHARTGPTVLPHRADVRLDDVDAFADHLVVSERADGLERLRVLHLGDDGDDRRRPRRSSPTSPCTRCGSGANPEYDDDDAALRVHVAGHAAVVVRLRRRRARGHAREAPAGARVRPRAVHVGAALGDGVRRHPGARSRSCTAATSAATTATRCSSTATARTSTRSTRAFSSARVLPPRPRLRVRDRARARRRRAGPPVVRGRQARCTRRNTFTDFIACAEHLVAEGYDRTRAGSRRAAAAPAGC